MWKIKNKNNIFIFTLIATIKILACRGACCVYCYSLICVLICIIGNTEEGRPCVRDDQGISELIVSETPQRSPAGAHITKHRIGMTSLLAMYATRACLAFWSGSGLFISQHTCWCCCHCKKRITCRQFRCFPLEMTILPWISAIITFINRGLDFCVLN